MKAWSQSDVHQGEPEGWEAQLSERRIKSGQVSMEQAGPLSFERQVTCAVNICVVLRLIPLTTWMVIAAAPGTFDGGNHPFGFLSDSVTLVSFATLT